LTDDLLERLKSSLLDLDMSSALADARAAADDCNGATAARAVDAVSEALQTVGKRFQGGEWFLAELVYAAEIAREVLSILSPHGNSQATRSLGTIVVGTVAGDLHDLGKNIFISYAKSVGFHIVDLGIDVPVDKFIDAVKRNRPMALGMSCIMTPMAGNLERVVGELKRQGLREQVKVIIGGAALTAEYASEIGVDAFAPDAVTGTDIVKAWSAEWTSNSES
jgi:5-methyltetrahydrofolate--homocysteine methyltransferase